MTKILFLISFIFLFYSFTLSPMTETIYLDKQQVQVQFQIENQTAAPTPVLITLVERHQKIDGSEERPEAQDLEAFPPQMIIPPKEKRTIRIKWKGQTPSQEKAYRIIAEQLPLNIEGEKSKGTGIKMLLKYEGTIYVNPGKTVSRVEIEKVSRKGGKLLVTMKNSGSAHQIFNGAILNLENSKGEKIKTQKGNLASIEGQNLLAGATRLFEFEGVLIPTSFDLAGIQGTVAFE